MNLRFFIDRPVFSGVISVVIVLLGMISMFSLPVEQYPDIAPPTINVFATYPGANAETVQKAVITPLEEAINGVEDMTYMTSTASNTGDASINIYFKQGTNADMAAVNVQNRVNGALSQLPAEATKTGVTTEKQQNAELMTFALYSPDDRFDQTFLKLFPNFLTEYNKFFRPEDQVILDEAGNLPPELRIFALIRLGVTENERIAKFLNLSINTIYVYKARVKGKTIVPKEEFEEYIMQIKKGI